MRVGIDCRKIDDGGIGVYLRNLLSCWRESGAAARFYLFGDPEKLRVFGSSGEFGEIIEHRYRKYSFSELMSFREPLRKLNIDLFYAPHYTLPFHLPCPSVVTIHDLIHLGQPVRYGIAGRTYARFIAGHACRKSDAILTDSEHSKKDILSFFPAVSNKISVIFPGVDRKIFCRIETEKVMEFRKDNGLPDDFVLYVGALKAHKNPRALAEIADNLGIPVVIASSDRLLFERNLLPLAKRRELLEFRLVEDQGQLALLYNAARVFVFPSFYEGFGLPPLEAMACGTPVVCSNRTSLPEVAGDAALTFSPDDSGEMLRAVEDCWHNRETRVRLREAGLKRASMFNWADTASAIFAVFQRAVLQ